MVFRTLDATNGALAEIEVHKKAAAEGEKLLITFRPTMCMLPMATRSSGPTTDIMKASRGAVSI